MPVLRLNPEQHVFVTERHLATLTTLRADGSPHVVPVAFTWDSDAGAATMTTRRTSMKVRHAMARESEDRGPQAALCQVDGGRWLTLEGRISVHQDSSTIAEAVARHARRYRILSPDPERVVLRLVVERVLCSAYMR